VDYPTRNRPIDRHFVLDTLNTCISNANFDHFRRDSRAGFDELLDAFADGLQGIIDDYCLEDKPEQ
jgi:hypothetical protein